MLESVPALPVMVAPSTGSTLAFLGVVAFIFGCFVSAFAWVWRGDAARWRVTILAALGLGSWMLVTAAGATSGAIAALAGSPKLMLYLVLTNGLALALVLSPVGLRLARGVPIAAIIGFQAFRLPLELVLHQWYNEGVIPIQMTYAGHNFDIVSGLGALVAAGLLCAPLSTTLKRTIAWCFTLLGTGLLLTVMSIAARSTPSPLRTYLNDPPVLLVFHAPYTWIVPICVAGALCGHGLAFRWLLGQRKAS